MAEFPSLSLLSATYHLTAETSLLQLSPSDKISSSLQSVEIFSSPPVAYIASESGYNESLTQLPIRSTSLNPTRRYSPELPMDSETLAQFLTSDGAIMFEDFGSEAPQADSEWTAENSTVNRYYSVHKDFWQEVDVRQLRESNAYIGNFRKLVNERFNLQAKAWQIAVMKNILKDCVDVVVSAGTSQGKSLTFQALPMLLTQGSGIVLVVCPTLSLMDDQVQKLTKKGIKAVQITKEEVQKDPSMYEQVRDGHYQIVYGSPEMILADGVQFNAVVLKATGCAFFKNLVCIAIDEAHVVWTWQSFWKDYRQLATLRSHYPSVPFLLLSATLALNLLGFLHVELHLQEKTRIYQISIDRPNITSVISPIRASGFSALDWVVPSGLAAVEIPKTMIFADNINKSQDLVVYLRRRLPNYLKTPWHRAQRTIRPYSASLTWDQLANNLTAFGNGDARILVCTDAAGLGVDIPDIKIIVQWKIARHLSLADLIQRMKRAGQDLSVQAIAVIMTNTSYIIPQDVTAEDEYAKLRSPVSRKTQSQTQEIIRELYFGRLASRVVKSSTPFDQIDPALLWFINTTGCRSQLVMANFVDRNTYRGERSTHCCDNCIYLRVNTPEATEHLTPLEFTHCGVSMDKSIRYDETEIGAEVLRSSRQKSKRRTSKKKDRTSRPLQSKCIDALNTWAEKTWPSIDSLVFSAA
ncbi:hypothetical protein MMC07_009259 [Pseudocyphellaria aurata]|nr:hypothetical protein [Pseudocyphellaria aurata]